MARIYTKNGDNGSTFLLFCEKVAKNDIRVECYGTIDECISFLGLAYSVSTEKNISEIIIKIQRNLFILSTEIACPKEKYNRLKTKYKTTKKTMIDQLEKSIDKYQKLIPEINYFVLPGSSELSSYIDISRTICRRAERIAVSIENMNLLNNKMILSYLNRLSDLLYTLARYVDREKEYLKATE